IRVLDPAQNVARDRHPHSALIHDIDVGERASLLRIDFGDGVGQRDRVADEYGREEAHAVIAERHGRDFTRGALAFLDHHRRTRRHVADDQRAVCYAPAEFRARHILLVDVVYGEIAGDAGKQIDVAFPHRLGEGDAVPDCDEEVLHCTNRSVMRSVGGHALFRGRLSPRGPSLSRFPACAGMSASEGPHPSSIRTTPSRASAALSEGQSPTPTTPSLVCAPTRCGGRRIAAALPSYRTG